MALIADTCEMYMFECLMCLGTYTGKPHELPELGWVRKAYKRKGSRTPQDVLLCGDCVKRLKPIWDAAKKKVDKEAA